MRVFEQEVWIELWAAHQRSGGPSRAILEGPSGPQDPPAWDEKVLAGSEDGCPTIDGGQVGSEP